MPLKRSNLIKISSAARLRGVERQTMYYHVRKHNLKVEEIDGTMYVDRDAAMKLPMKRKETELRIADERAAKKKKIKKPSSPKTK
jgi:hypothetical protein